MINIIYFIVCAPGEKWLIESRKPITFLIHGYNNNGNDNNNTYGSRSRVGKTMGTTMTFHNGRSYMNTTSRELYNVNAMLHLL